MSRDENRVSFHFTGRSRNGVQKKLNPTLLVAAGGAILLLCLNLGLAVNSAAQQRNTALQVRENQQILLGLERILSYAKDAETGQRGYLLANSKSYLAPYEAAVANIDAEFARVKGLLGKEQDRIDQLALIEGTWTNRLNFLKRGIAIRDANPDVDVRKFIMTGRGKQEMDELRSRVAAMENEYEAALVQSENDAASTYQRSITTALIAGIAAVAAVLVALTLLIRSIQTAARDAATIHEQREILETTLISIGDAVITTDENAKVTFLNRIAEDLTGWSNQDAQGVDLEQVFTIINEYNRGPVENPALRALREGVIVGLANHTILISRDGKEHPIDDSAAPIKTQAGVIAGSVLIFRDITERKKTEDDLRRIAADLSEADRRKDEFLATLAHELRNPLAPVVNAVELLKFRGTDEEILTISREVIERQVTHLSRLIDDLLDLSRITRNKLELRFERVLLEEVIQSAVEAARPLIAQNGHEFTIDLPSEPIVLRADSIRLSQIVTNLLNNAAKYTPQGGQISLKVQRSGSEVEISVKDNGIGIPLENQERLFEMFYQVDRSMERSHSGLGIGLALVRRLAELHGGGVSAKSGGRGQGTEIVVTLPIIEAEDVPSKPAAPEHVLQGRRILLADDNEDIVATLSMLLRTMGNDVTTASNGNEALSEAERVRPEIILLDIGMPKLNGYEVCRLLREQAAFASTIIIALTGWGQDEDRERSTDAGFDAHLVKPVDRAMLERVLQEIESRLR